MNSQIGSADFPPRRAALKLISPRARIEFSTSKTTVRNETLFGII
jgi:hypothetical protein